MQNNRLKLIEITKDGSPTMRMNGSPQNPQYSEQMHYSTGAASETIYVYGEAIKQAQMLLKSDSTHYLVVGLGLGYIEILISLLTGGDFKQILSFEKDEQLICDFTEWCNFKKTNLYDQVAQALVSQLKIESPMDLVRASLQERLQITSALENPQNMTTQKFNVICYDAFSNKMDQRLWDFDFLNQFIQEYSADQCVFASYSKTGDLNRALKQNGFILIDRKGFSTKRECTLAIKTCR